MERLQIWSVVCFGLDKGSQHALVRCYFYGSCLRAVAIHLLTHTMNSCTHTTATIPVPADTLHISSRLPEYLNKFVVFFSPNPNSFRYSFRTALPREILVCLYYRLRKTVMLTEAQQRKQKSKTSKHHQNAPPSVMGKKTKQSQQRIVNVTSAWDQEENKLLTSFLTCFATFTAAVLMLLPMQSYRLVGSESLVISHPHFSHNPAWIYNSKPNQN